MSYKKIYFIFLIIYVFSFSAYSAKVNYSDKSKIKPIEFYFFENKITMHRVFNVDKTLFANNKMVPLASKLVSLIYRKKLNTNIRIQAAIMLAKILYQNNMKITSLHVLQSILIHKSSSHLIPLVFKIMVNIITELNNDYIVSNYFQYIDRSTLSKDNLTAINYFYAKALFKNNKLKQARKIFEKLDPKHHKGKYYYLSRYYLATIYYLQNNKKKAIPYLDDIFATDKSKIPLELQAQGRLLAGRIYSDLNILDQAVYHYELVPKDSLTWDQALLEVAWIYLRKGDFKKVVGRTHSLNSPFFLMYYFPDGYIIEALGYMKLCRFGRAKAILDGFKRTFSEYRPLLKKFNGSYIDLSNRRTLPSRIVKTFARNKVFRSHHRAFQQLRFENARLDRFNVYSKEKRSYAKYAKKFYLLIHRKISAQRKHHLTQLNKYLKSETLDLYKNMGRLYTKYEFILYEMYAQAKKYLQHSLVDSGKIVLTEKERKESADNRLYIWKFDYEYWKDELPFYEHAGINTCHNR